MVEGKFSRRSLLWLGMGALGTFGACQLGRSQEVSSPLTMQLGEHGLKTYAQAQGVLYGSAVRFKDLKADPEYAARVAQECGVLVPEWTLKWHVSHPESPPLRPAPDQFDFTGADWIANFARTHGLPLRGHTLVWYNSLPPWLAETINAENAEAIMVNHIQTVAGRYAGQMHSWDVVNEAIAHDPTRGRSDGLRETPWLEFIGPDYVERAFEVAAQTDPDALLVYNDYGLDYDTRENDAKRTAVLKLLERLKNKGAPVHALGTQAHLWGDRDQFNARKLQTFFRNVADLGLKIMITEMDVNDKNLPSDIGKRDQQVAHVYQEYLTTALAEPAVIAVITWALSDRYTWLSEFHPRADGLPVRPMPLDNNLERKPAWESMAQAFASATSR